MWNFQLNCWKGYQAGGGSESSNPAKKKNIQVPPSWTDIHKNQWRTQLFFSTRMLIYYTLTLSVMQYIAPLKIVSLF